MALDLMQDLSPSHAIGDYVQARGSDGPVADGTPATGCHPVHPAAMEAFEQARQGDRDPRRVGRAAADERDRCEGAATAARLAGQLAAGVAPSSSQGFNGLPRWSVRTATDSPLPPSSARRGAPGRPPRTRPLTRVPLAQRDRLSGGSREREEPLHRREQRVFGGLPPIRRRPAAPVVALTTARGNSGQYAARHRDAGHRRPDQGR